MFRDSDMGSWEHEAVGEAGGGRRPYERLSAEERARFLEVLRETGNRKAAAAAIGIEPRLMDQRREHDADLDRDWEAAVEACHQRLSAAEGPFDCPQGAGPNMVRRGKNGRLQLVAAGEGRWSGEIEERFRTALRACGNVRAAAHAVGFSESAIWQRRRQWPAFAQMLEEMLDEAELALEFRIASMGSNVAAGDGYAPEAESACGAPTPSPSLQGRGIEGATPQPFDPDFAMRFLKWREERRRGRGRWAPRAKPPSLEAVTEKLVRRVEAIKRHRARDAQE